MYDPQAEARAALQLICLDDCDTCEPSLDTTIELELENKRLQNELLKKQIELLEKSAAYRCCPAGECEPAA